MKALNCNKWIHHFKLNRKDRREPDWFGIPVTITDQKRRHLAATLAQYQLGDGGGPCCLIARDAEKVRGSAVEVRQVIDLWFREEAEHSRLLGEAVLRLRGDFVTDSFAFRLFKLCRRLLNAQFEMLVLLIVEIVSTGYYRMVRRHCGDRPVADMCGLILRDEAGHIAFHRDRLAVEHPQGVHRVWEWYFYSLGYACTAFLWLSHGKWLRGIGGKRAELFQHVRHGLRRFLRQLQPKPIRRAETRSIIPVPEMSSRIDLCSAKAERRCTSA
jgi:hypothetical protein